MQTELLLHLWKLNAMQMFTRTQPHLQSLQVCSKVSLESLALALCELGLADNRPVKASQALLRDICCLHTDTSAIISKSHGLVSTGIDMGAGHSSHHATHDSHL